MLKKLCLARTVRAAGFLTVVTVAPALACDQSEYHHNGSVMTVYACDGRMVIDYEKPKSALARVGVKLGTVLFRGTYLEMAGGIRINGQARVFKRGCKPGSYEVNGWIMDDERSFALEGTAPVRDANCRPSRYRQDILTFHSRD